MNAPVDVSVVVCAYTLDRWDLLRRAVTSVETQLRGRPGEVVSVGRIEPIIVIDHNAELLERAQREWPRHTVVPNHLARGLSGARNTGIGMSSGEVVAFLDDDAAADRLWLAHLVRHFVDPTVWGVGGHVEPDYIGEGPEWLPAEFGWVVGCSYRGQPTTVREVRNPIGANMAFRRQAFAAVGGFRDGLGRVGKTPLGCEETEFAIRVRNHGGRVLHDPDARVRHTVSRDRAHWRYFVHRCWAEGLSKAAVVGLTGADAGLSSERSYLTGVLPLALWTSAKSAIRGPGRSAAAARSVAIVAGSLVTASGFARGRVAGDVVGSTS